MNNFIIEVQKENVLLIIIIIKNIKGIVICTTTTFSFLSTILLILKNKSKIAEV